MKKEKDRLERKNKKQTTAQDASENLHVRCEPHFTEMQAKNPFSQKIVGDVERHYKHSTGKLILKNMSIVVTQQT